MSHVIRELQPRQCTDSDYIKVSLKIDINLQSNSLVEMVAVMDLITNFTRIGNALKKT